MAVNLLEAQSNTIRGLRSINSGEDLTGKEARLVMLADAGTQEEVVLPNAVTDICPFVVLEAGDEDENSTVIPLCSEQQVRVLIKGTCNAGDVLVLQTPDGTDDGKVAAIGATAGVYFSPGFAEEDGADGQLVKIRPCPRMVFVSGAWTVQNANNAVAGLTFSATATQAECQAFRDLVEKMNDDLIALKVILKAQNLVKDAG